MLIAEQDKKRLFDEGFKSTSTTLIAGVDEAGRGPLAGPVVAAAVILTDMDKLPFINDSKQLSPKKRHALFTQLQDSEHVHIGFSIVDEATIDKINIFQATLKAMSEAVKALPFAPELALIDGKFCPDVPMPARAVVKGDAHSLSIGAASIIAKEVRDQLMLELDQQWPQYGFAKHKGYGTAYHLAQLKAHGPCSCHRVSFAPVKALK